MYYNLQALRAFAAYAVVVHHILFTLNHYLRPDLVPIGFSAGAHGVDIFFVISGFIMAATTDGRQITAQSFLVRRIIRILPIYWLLTALAFVLIASGFALFGQRQADLGLLLRSWLFLPLPDAQGVVAKPLLFVGWSLDLEMMFYGLFALALWLNRRRGSAIAALLVFALWAAARIFPENAVLHYSGAMILLHFIAGIALWHVTRACTLAPRASLALAAAAILALILSDPVFGWTAESPLRFFLVSLSPPALVFALISLDERGWRLKPGHLTEQGDASYSIYLLHPFVLQALGKLSIVTGLNASGPGLALTILAMLAVTAVAGTLFYRHIERPITQKLRAATKRLHAAEPAQ